MFGSGLDYIMMAYNCFVNGYLPHEGGWLDQTNIFIEAMIECQRGVAEAEKSMSERERALQKIGR